MRRLAAGNWKMNGSPMSLTEVTALMKDHPAPGCEMLLCPPATLIAQMAWHVRGAALKVGGQDCHTGTTGAHTGDISAQMLADAGASYVILGHSERRADHGETDAVVKAKAVTAIAHGLTPIICVGETLAQREAGEAESVVRAQLAGSLPNGFAAAGGVVAYEPVWAIGTGKTPTEADIAAIHAALREAAGVTTRLLYGGSVKPGNAAAILALPHVDGALVGGAALVAEDFLAIARAAG